jgi:hypothetical protein
MQVWGQVHYHVLNAKKVTNTLLSHTHFLQLLEPVLFYMTVNVRILLVYFLSKKDANEHTFSINSEITNKAGTQRPEYLR